jgi:protein TonB
MAIRPQRVPRWLLIIGGIAALLVLVAILLVAHKLPSVPPFPGGSAQAPLETPQPLQPAQSATPKTELVVPQSSAPKPGASQGSKSTIVTRPSKSAREKLITRPRWIRRPNADQLMDMYPPDALSRGLGGYVVLDCVVAAKGSLICAVLSETPLGKGFGRAALSASKQFEIAPQDVGGRPTLGRHIRIPVRFDPPKDG